MFFDFVKENVRHHAKSRSLLPDGWVSYIAQDFFTVNDKERYIPETDVLFSI